MAWVILFIVVIVGWLPAIVANSIIARRKGFYRPRWALFSVIGGPFATIFYRRNLPTEAEASYLHGQRDRRRTPIIVPTDEEVAAIKLGVGSIVEGRRAFIDIEENGIKIRRAADISNVILQGLKGEKSISYRSISAVQLRMPDGYTAGYIQFSVLGGVESKLGLFAATTDENTVVFTDGQSAGMLALRAYLNRRTEIAHRQNGAASSVADELSKLAELRERGILTQDEFDQQKNVLLRD